MPAISMAQAIAIASPDLAALGIRNRAAQMKPPSIATEKAV